MHQLSGSAVPISRLGVPAATKNTGLWSITGGEGVALVPACGKLSLSLLRGEKVLAGVVPGYASAKRLCRTYKPGWRPAATKNTGLWSITGGEGVALVPACGKLPLGLPAKESHACVLPASCRLWLPSNPYRTSCGGAGGGLPRQHGR